MGVLRKYDFSTYNRLVVNLRAMEGVPAPPVYYGFDRWYTQAKEYHDYRDLLIKLSLTIEKEFSMARGRKNNKEKSPDGWDKATWRGFSHIQVTEDDLGDIERWAEGVDVPDLLFELLLQGYKVTYSPLNEGRTVQCAITGVYERTGENAGLMLSAYAGTPQAALVVVLYKHYVAAEREWPDEKQGRFNGIG